MKAPKVAVAYQEKWPEIKRKLTNMHIDTAAFRIFIRGFKSEKKLELWVSSKTSPVYQLYNVYPICASSGEPGPKRREGDGQVPEGFYSISVFNPYSNYYVSLGINYPNQSDRILGNKNALGGAIMIHGNCVTIGCIPLTDDKIKEVYVLAVEAKNSGQLEIPVHLFPEALSNWHGVEKEMIQKYGEGDSRIMFWKNLSEGYDYFENSHKIPEVRVSVDGKYTFR